VDEQKLVCAAFVKAQSEFPEIEKGTTVKVGTKYSYKYAELSDIIKAIRPILSSNKLAVMQEVKSYNEEISVSTLLIHESGQILQSGHVSMKRPEQAKDIGGAITYLKRYSLCAFLGIVAEDDLDAEPENVTSVEKKGRSPLDVAKSDMGTLFNERGITDTKDRMDYCNDVLKPKEPILSSVDLNLKQCNKVNAKLKSDIETIKASEVK
jgi:hypothetical protein